MNKVVHIIFLFSNVNTGKIETIEIFIWHNMLLPCFRHVHQIFWERKLLSINKTNQLTINLIKFLHICVFINNKIVTSTVIPPQNIFVGQNRVISLFGCVPFYYSTQLYPTYWRFQDLIGFSVQRGAFPGTLAVEVSWLYNLFLLLFAVSSWWLHSLVYISSLRCHFLWNLPAWWWACHRLHHRSAGQARHGYLQTRCHAMVVVIVAQNGPLWSKYHPPLCYLDPSLINLQMFSTLEELGPIS